MSELAAIGIFVIATAILIFSIIVLSHILNLQKSTNKDKEDPYECGIIPKGDARGRLSVRFFLMAILFVVFDIEVVFLFPWAVVQKKLSWLGLIEAGTFILILLMGFFYAWAEGVFDWK